MSEELSKQFELEQKAKDQSCDLAKREHKWRWIWQGGKITNQVQCSKCGQTKQLGK